MGQLEFAFFLRMGAGESAFLVTEEFAFEKVLGNGAAIYDDEWVVFPRAMAMNGVGNDLFTGAALTAN